MRTGVLLVLVLAACGSNKSDRTSDDTDPKPITNSGSGSGSAGTPAVPSVTPDEAVAFAARVNQELLAAKSAADNADWARQTNITDETTKAAADANEKLSTLITKLIRDSRRFEPIMDKLDADTRRQIQLLRISGTPGPENMEHAAQLAQVMAEMDGLYGKGTICDGKPGPDGKPTCRDIDIEKSTETMAKSRKPAELLATWETWHKVGTNLKPLYVQFVGLANEGARGVGFADTGAQWRSRYDMPPDDMVSEADRLWGQVKPLYDQLHCYVRRKLSAKYGAKIVPPTGPMPAHVLGNLWAQDWSNVYDLVEPYPGQPSPDVTKTLVAKKYTPEQMTKLAEGFFVSLGMTPLPQTFWERSMLSRPKDKKVVCHASAWDPNYNGDVRIKMCIQINQEDMVTLHHELGHDYYYLNYFTKPVLFQDGANDGFHEAIGDTIALSITPAYLKQVGLLADVAANDKAVIDRMMFTALDKIAFLPWGLLVDKWRWEVFAGTVKPEQYNDRWWELRNEYQGIAAPITRTAADFDPGAKYHVPGNTPYLRYFLSTILQFQFHRALCKTAGHTGPLHECSIYGNKEAGARLAATLAMGSSKPWPDALEALTGARAMDASAILEYFAPLQGYLTEQNQGQTCGW
jgi:peptidyl-dipeptidase A